MKELGLILVQSPRAYTVTFQLFREELKARKHSTSLVPAALGGHCEKNGPSRSVGLHIGPHWRKAALSLSKVTDGSQSPES